MPNSFGFEVLGICSRGILWRVWLRRRKNRHFYSFGETTFTCHFQNGTHFWDFLHSTASPILEPITFEHLFSHIKYLQLWYQRHSPGKFVCICGIFSYWSECHGMTGVVRKIWFLFVRRSPNSQHDLLFWGSVFLGFARHPLQWKVWWSND